MGNIVLLDDLTINKIAAGEVIERPANVVKELVENSIDAGSSKIIIEIKKGGKAYISVTDNGKGIEKDDMLISLERHATSKIRRVEDLEKTYTMGFRGEALASIASISELTMISKTKETLLGQKIKAKAGEVIEAEECRISNRNNNNSRKFIFQYSSKIQIFKTRLNRKQIHKRLGTKSSTSKSGNINKINK